MVAQIEATLSRSKNSKTIYITLPSSLTQDSQFPIPEEDEKVIVTVKNGTLVVSRVKSK